MDRPLYDAQKTDTLLGTESDLYVRQQREQNYLRRMVPHVLGWFPCTAAWVILIVHLEWAKHDLSLVTDREIPEWVNGAIYGTVIIFWSFTVVQIIFQYLPRATGPSPLPCSAERKLYLGFFLLVNVIMTDGTVEGALAPPTGNKPARAGSSAERQRGACACAGACHESEFFASQRPGGGGRRRRLCRHPARPRRPSTRRI